MHHTRSLARLNRKQQCFNVSNCQHFCNKKKAFDPLKCNYFFFRGVTNGSKLQSPHLFQCSVFLQNDFQVLHSSMLVLFCMCQIGQCLAF